MASVLCSAARTPIGSFQGRLSSCTAPDLGAVAIEAVLRRSETPGAVVDEVVMGNVITAGIGQAPARQAALQAGIPQTAPCLTINKVCGSSMKAVMLADQYIRAGDVELVVAGGQESMSNAPYLLPKARSGYYLGHAELVDAMLKDGLMDAYEQKHMGVAADRCAEACGVPRSVQDDFARESYRRAQTAIEKGLFDDEIVPVVFEDEGADERVDTDEGPAQTGFDRFPELDPVFTSDGTVTPANASTINDGASAMIVASEEAAAERGLPVMARIVAHVQHSGPPMEYPLAPVDAVQKLLEKAGMTIPDVDLFEVNEAFAVVALVAQDRLGLPHERLNVNGGAVALGHPIGASGARILTTLLYALEQRDLRYGLAAICIGGGEATAMLVERVK